MNVALRIGFLIINVYWDFFYIGSVFRDFDIFSCLDLDVFCFVIELPINFLNN